MKSSLLTTYRDILQQLNFCLFETFNSSYLISSSRTFTLNHFHKFWINCAAEFSIRHSSFWVGFVRTHANKVFIFFLKTPTSIDSITCESVTHCLWISHLHMNSYLADFYFVVALLMKFAEKVNDIQSTFKQGMDSF